MMRWIALGAMGLGFGGVATAAGCSAGEGQDLVGVAEVAITEVPSDGSVGCIKVKATGATSVTQSFDVQPGQSTTLSLQNLPTGTVRFLGDAYAGACSGVTSASVPTWTSSPVYATVGTTPVSVTLEMKPNGQATVGVDFPDASCRTSGEPCLSASECCAGACVNNACASCNVNADCPGASCSGFTLTSASTCNGSHACVAGSSAPCAGNLICATATACKTSCASNSDCQSGSVCQNPGPSGTCVASVPAGSVCSANSQCSSGKCGTTGTGHCCTASCSATVGACGASDCDDTGACVYPGNVVAPAALQTPGDCQKVVCNGSGGVASLDDPTNVPSPAGNACLTNPACCGPSPLTPCFTPAPTDTPCTSASDPSAHVCGATSNGNVAGTCVECNSDADCLAVDDAGVLACNTSLGLCE